MSLTDTFDETHARLKALEAADVELTEGPDAALEILGAPADPIRMRATLGILLRADRQIIASDLIKDQRPHEKWVELGAVIFAFLGDVSQAMKYVDFADALPDTAVMRRTRLAFAEGVIEKWQEQCSGDSLLVVRQWSESDIDLARTVIEVLEPVVSLVRANRRIQNATEVAAITYAVFSARIASDAQLVIQGADWLIKYIPVPLVVAELCLRRIIACPPGFSNRLRVEHGQYFQAKLLAALVDRELFNRPDDAFDELIQLSASATNDQEKESVCVEIFQTTGMCSSDRFEQAIQTLTVLRPTDTRMVGLLKTAQSASAGHLEEAKSTLELLRDEADGVWWQVNAQLCRMDGDETAAQLAWEKASELLPHPDVLRRSVQASFDCRKYESAIRSLKKLLAANPDSQKELKAISSALISLGDYVQAAEYLERLVAIVPSNIEYRTSLAQSLGRCGRIATAITVLEPVSGSDDPPLETLLLHCELLGADGRHDEAFRLLQSIAGDNWDNPQYLIAYMNCGHAANEDGLAHEAFARLVELRSSGNVPSELFQQGTLEQLLEYGKEYQNRRESLQGDVVGGRMPWLFAEDVLGNPPLWAWILHTQELRWLSEERLSRAAFSVYATNSFASCNTSKGQLLVPLIAPPQGTEVVLDLSAILTLHQLDRLGDAVSYFGHMLIPASYGELRLRDSTRFGQHQPSRETALQRIRSEIERQRLHVLEGDASAMITVDEYSDDKEPHSYRFRDFIAPLMDAQKITADSAAALLKVAHKPSGVDEQHPPLKLGSQVAIDLISLRTLVTQQCFDSIAESFSLHITNTQRDELYGDIQAHQRARDALTTHNSLWDSIGDLVSLGTVTFQPMPIDGLDEEELDDGDHDTPIHLHALTLARHLKKPLLIDDRVLQVMMSLTNEGEVPNAFGSDCLLHALMKAKHISLENIADNYLQLMLWRYRFLMPSPELLFKWAEINVESLPGNALLDVAAYLHDCLRDPGLHCGLEETDTPISIAIKLVTQWIHSITAFLADIWDDKRFTDEQASILTRWTGEELVPSCPLGHWLQPLGQNIVRAEASTTLGMLMIAFTHVGDRRRANLGLRLFAESLGITDTEFLRVAAETIHGVK